MDLERLAVVALPAAHLAGNVDIRQELHLDLDDSVALAVLAATALDVEREAARAVTAQTGFRYTGEQLADGREQANVSRRIGARGPADGRLVDLDDLVDRFRALQRVVLARLVARAAHGARERSEEDLRHERALAAARHAGHRRHRPERERHVDVLQVVGTRLAHDERLATALAPLLGHRHCPLATQERAGDRARRVEDRLERSGGDDLAAVLAGAGSDVEHPVGRSDRLLVVLDDDERVAQVAQAHQRRDELGVVLLMEPDGRLVEDVQDAHQRRADLRREPDALCLAATQRR